MKTANRYGKPALQEPEQMKPEGSPSRVDMPPSAGIFENPMFHSQLMEEVLERKNMQLALKRVMANKGAPGVDGITTEELAKQLRSEWSVIKAQLLVGAYHPRPIRRVDIPKPGTTEKRQLGIPSCIDRLIQQALLQALSPQYEKVFSDGSFGFRPKRGCHKAITRSQEHIQSGYGIVVDLDLSKFFDRVHHERLMSRLRGEIADSRILTLIRRYLEVGVLEDGLVSVRTEGTPQGSPLSPLLSNIVLDELDKELEKRELHFVRYADDIQIYVKSPRAGERVLESISRFIERRMRLRVNLEKSAVDRVQKRTFLGFTFTGGKAPNRPKISTESIRRFKSQVRRLTRRRNSVSLEDRIARLNIYLRGWRGYFGYTEARSIFLDLDAWIRRRLRCCVWKQWKTYSNRKKNLIALGVRQGLAHTTAWSSKGPWRVCHTPGVRMALNNKYFDNLGLIRLMG